MKHEQISDEEFRQALAETFEDTPSAFADRTLYQNAEGTRRVVRLPVQSRAYNGVGPQFALVERRVDNLHDGTPKGWEIVFLAYQARDAVDWVVS